MIGTIEAAPPQSRGIAHLARTGTTLHAKRQVDYRTLPSRSVLNRCDSPRVHFQWTINPYRGCEIGCKYCYARYTHEFMDLTPMTFEEQIFAKDNVGELLRRELHQVKPGESIAIGTVTDPYQPAEKRYRRTHAILSVLADWEGLDFSITTKSNLVTRDLELLQRLVVRHRLGVNVTITTVDRRLAHALEPKAPRPDLRLKTVSELAAAGVPVGVFAMPVLPGITDDPVALDRLAAAAAGAGAAWFVAAPVFLMPSSMAVFFPFLEQEFPDLVERYQRDFERSAYMPKTYAAGLRDLVRKLRTKHRLVTPDDGRRRPAEISGPQLSLF